MGKLDDRERRLKAKGTWFQKPKKIKTWQNHIFPIILILSLVCYLHSYSYAITPSYIQNRKNIIPKMV